MRIISFIAALQLFSLGVLGAPNQIPMGVVNWGAQQLGKIGDNGAHTTASWDYRNCGQKGDALTIKSIKMNPDPPVPGKDLTVLASGTANRLIDRGAFADVLVKLGLIKLLQKRFDLCDEMANANTTLQCPVEPGDYVIEHTIALPEEIPRAKFLINIRAFTQDESHLGCLDLMLNFLPI